MRNNPLLKKIEYWLFFFVLVLLPTQLGKHFWPSFASIYSLPIDYLSPTLYLWDLLVVGLVVVHGIQNFTVKNLGRTSLPLHLLTLFIATNILSLYTANNLGAGMVRLEQLVVVSLFGFYLSTLSWSTIQESLPRPLVVAFLAEITISALQFFNQGSIGLWVLGERSFRITTPAIAKFNFLGLEMLRPYATFPHPNVLAGFIVLMTPLLLFFSQQRKWKILVVGLGTFGVLVSSSRPAIVVYLLQLFWKLKIHFRAFALTLFIALIPFFFVRFGSLISYDSLSITRREDLAYSAWTLFTAHPLWGVGLNNFVPQLANLPMVSGESRFLQPVHNIFLLQLAETGIVGLSGLVVFLGVPLSQLWKKRKDPFVQLLLSAWASLLFLSLFDHYFLTLPQGMRLLFLVWGLSFARLRALRYD